MKKTLLNDFQRPLVVTCDWIPPAFGAVGQYEWLRAREAALSGRRVTLIGLGQAPSDESALLGEGELRVVRIAANAPDKGNLLKRAAWALVTNLRLLNETRAAVRFYGCSEIKVTGSPPFFSYLLLVWRCLFWRRKRRDLSVTYRITDFYPETAFAAGKATALTFLGPLIFALRRSADRIEALSDCQKRRLVECGVKLDQVEIVRDASPVTFVEGASCALGPHTDDTVRLLYSGNLGVAHDWHTFAEGYRRHIHEGTNRVRLWLSATGVGVSALKGFCEAHALPINVSKPVPLEDLASLLLSAHAHLILLGNPFWGYVFPSKTYACLESNRQCLYVGPEQSDVHSLMGTSNQNFSLRQGDYEGVFAALEQLSMG